MSQFFNLRIKIIFFVISILALNCLFNFVFIKLIGFEASYFQLLSYSVNLGVISIVLLNKTRVFLNLWHIEKWGIGEKLSLWVGPDLNGRYEAVFESNYKQKQNPDTEDTTLSLPSQARPVDIEVTWGKVVINMEVGEKSSQSSSRTSPVRIYKEDDEVTLEYVFLGKVPAPEKTDEKYYDGAAKLNYQLKNGVIVLEGTYWTNRSYQRGLNTAGRISLTAVT